MNKNIRGAIIAFFVVGFILLAAYCAADFLPASTSTPTGLSAVTITPTSTINPFSVARITIDGPCRTGTSEKHDVVTTIPQGKDVWLIGKDNEMPNWLLVRWGIFPDCWVEKRYLTTNDINLVPVQPTPLLSTYTPTFTSTPTSTLTPSPSPSPTSTRTRSGPIATRTPTPTKGDAIGMTDTPTNPSVTPPTPTNTPATPPTSTKTPVTPPTPTKTPATPPTPTKTPVTPPTPTKTPATPPTPTKTPVTPPTPTKTPVTPPTPTKTPVTPPTPTNTPVTLPTPTNTPVTLPTPTNTPSGNRACNDNIDNDGDGFIDLADAQCKNKGDNDESK